jgi:hypothetical protein
LVSGSVDIDSHTATQAIHSQNWFGLSLMKSSSSINLFAPEDVLVLQREPVFWSETKLSYLSVERLYLVYSDHEGCYVENVVTTIVIQREQICAQQVQKLYVTRLLFGYFTLALTVVVHVSSESEQGSVF